MVMTRIVRITTEANFMKTVGAIAPTFLDVPKPTNASQPFAYTMGLNTVRVLCTMNHISDGKVAFDRDRDHLEADSDVIFDLMKGSMK